MEKNKFNYTMLLKYLKENGFKKLGANAQALILEAVEQMAKKESDEANDKKGNRK